MIIKRIVTISLFSALGIMLVLLLVGLFVPTKTLEKFSRANSDEQTVVAVDKDGKTIEGAIIKVQADGTTVVVDSSGQAIAGASAAAQAPSAVASAPAATTPAAGGGSTTPSSGGTTAPPATGGGTTTPPTIGSFTASPGSVAYNASSTLSWTSSNATACSISTLGSVAVTGTKSTGALTATKAYTITCTGSGTATKSVTVSVAAAPPVSSCGSGGSCTSADITPHATASDCRSAFTSGTSGQPAKGAYQITAAFITTHNGQKSGVILSKLCGKTNYASNLRNATADHKGTQLTNKTYDGWIANFYIGPYN